MAVYHAVENTLVPDQDLPQVKTSAPSGAFSMDPAAESGQRLTTVPSGVERVPFTPIGMGKPLAIEIRHVYTGQFPKPKVFSKKKDMLVTSAIKSLATFEAAPRAVNFMKHKVGPKTNFRTPAATEEGTPLVYYTPALVETSTVLTLEIGFDEFPDQAFGAVSSALSAAAGLPIFVAQSAYLVAAGSLAKLAGDIGQRIFDQGPVFKTTVALTFERPGSVPPQADYRLLVSDTVMPSQLQGLKVNEDGILVSPNGDPFQGDFPYVVISLDGRANKSYEGFSPAAASAAILERFFAVGGGQEQSIEPLVEGLKLFSDIKFRRQADALAEQMKGLDPGSAAFKQLKAQYDAQVANILEGELKPKPLELAQGG